MAPIVQAGYFRNAQAPATGFAALSGPARLVMLTEQTRDYEAGRYTRVFGMLKRYVAATGALMLVAVPILWIFMPYLIGVAYGPTFRAHATDAARLVLLAAALQVVWGWTKSFPVSIGRPGLRVIVQSIEIAVFIPLLLIFASRWGATGAAGAMLASTVGLLRDLDGDHPPARGLAPLDGTGGAVKVVIVSGIWPPDVGGPASHAPEVAAFLRARRHDVEVVITADSEPAPEPYPVHWVSRSMRPGVRHAAVVKLLAGLARHANVVYTTGMLGRSSLGALVARTPFVTKLTADPAYERARRWGLSDGSLEEFQLTPGARTLPLRLTRDLDVRRAAHVVTPSAYLRELAIGWGVPADRVTLLPNPTPPVSGLPPHEELRKQFGLTGPTLVFAGRLTAQKSLDLGIEAARRAGVDLVIAGDGPDREALEALGYGRFLGALPRQKVLELFRAGDASLLSSSWENFPHTVVEALAVGTPVIATRTGGVAEVLEDGVNGLLVDPGDVEALTAAIDRFFLDPALAGILTENAVESVADYAPDRVYGRLERILITAAG